MIAFYRLLQILVKASLFDFFVKQSEEARESQKMWIFMGSDDELLVFFGKLFENIVSSNCGNMEISLDSSSNFAQINPLPSPFVLRAAVIYI